jgi:suppressor of fused protein SUFU
MSTPEQTRNDEWTKIWDARMAALTPILSQPSGTVFHATIPFQFRDVGGTADVVPFPNYVPGLTYVTAELTGGNSGQRPSSLGNYELMICTQQQLESAADFISRLACYTCDAELEAGETMDIEDFFGDSTLRAMLFTHPGEQPVHFEFLGQRYALLLCIGITAEELAFARSRSTAELLALLKQHGVFPYTIPGRPSVSLPLGGSLLGRLFGR